MNGELEPREGITGIVFSDFYTHPGYQGNAVLDSKKIAWSVFTDFRMGDSEPDWDKVTIIITCILRRQKDRMRISELKCESTFRVTADMSFDYKCRMIFLLIDHTVGHLQGGWVAKQSGTGLKTCLPQAFYLYRKIESDLKKHVFERWE
jgi:hypothetical protein